MSRRTPGSAVNLTSLSEPVSSRARRSLVTCVQWRRGRQAGCDLGGLPCSESWLGPLEQEAWDEGEKLSPEQHHRCRPCRLMSADLWAWQQNPEKVTSEGPRQETMSARRAGSGLPEKQMAKGAVEGARGGQGGWPGHWERVGSSRAGRRRDRMGQRKHSFDNQRQRV